MKRIANLLKIITLVLIPSLAYSQATVDYKDVGVIMNTRSKNSVAITTYFAKARKIPAQNIIRISVDTSSESISNTRFDSIRTAIEDTLKTRKGILNYLVTTKGCPLKVIYPTTYCNLIYNIFSLMDSVKCASFESELMLILGKYNTHIGQADVIIGTPKDSTVRLQPYFEQKGHFTRKQYDIILVTRLDAFTLGDIKKMIDKSGPNTLINKDSVQFVLDNITTMYDSSLNNSFYPTAQILKKRGWKVNSDSTSALIDKQRNVLGYLSWGYTDPTYVAQVKKGIFLNNSFSAASIGSTYYSYTGWTFYTSVTKYKATINPLFSKGLCGGITHVLEPFSYAMAEPMVLFDKYTDTTQDLRFNLAESYYSASATMSWMTTIVGDPKTSIVTHIPPIPAPRLDTIKIVCQNDIRKVTANSSQQGYYNWFTGDSNSLKTLGKPLDSLNPLWKASGKTFTVPSATLGTFTFTYVNENFKGRALRQISYTVVNCTTGFESPLNNIDFEIYPNPAYQHFTLSYKGEKAQNISINVTDVLGRSVYSNIILNVSDIKEDINISGKPAGVYFITLNLNGQKVVKKIVME